MQPGIATPRTPVHQQQLVTVMSLGARGLFLGDVQVSAYREQCALPLLLCFSLPGLNLISTTCSTTNAPLPAQAGQTRFLPLFRCLADEVGPSPDNNEAPG